MATETLFGKGEAMPKERPSRQTINALVSRFGFKESAVSAWSKERAESTLQMCVRQEHATLSRAASLAREAEPELPELRHPTEYERLEMAAYLDEAAVAGPNHLALAVSGAVFMLPNPALKRLAEQVAQVLLGNES